MHLSGFGDTMTSGELGFDFRVRKSGDVEITHLGRLAATLRGDAAQSFLAEVEAMDDEDEQQQLMARVSRAPTRASLAAPRGDRSA